MLNITTNPFVNQVVQIQIQAVDKGFFVQAVNIDGKNKSVRGTAETVSELRSLCKTIVDGLFENPPSPAEAQPASGPAGTQSPAGT